MQSARVLISNVKDSANFYTGNEGRIKKERMKGRKAERKEDKKEDKRINDRRKKGRKNAIREEEEESN
jgi:hypothetical protein